jgi:hypothetical protein
VSLALPVPLLGNAAYTVHGSGVAVISGRHALHVTNIGSTTVVVRPENTAGTYNSVGSTALSTTVPATWANGDILGVSFWYFAA